MQVGIRKLTEEQFNEFKHALDNGEWLKLLKYTYSGVTRRRIRKSKTYQDYVGKNGKYGKPPDVTSQTNAPPSSYTDELSRLVNLKQKGVITQQEFDAKKKQLLGL